MWRNISLIYPSILFLLLAVGSTLGVGYTINYSILQDVLQDRVETKADQVTQTIQKELAEKVNHLLNFQNSWVANLSWLATPEPQPPNSNTPNKPSPEFLEKWARVSQFFPLWKMDFLLVIDLNGNVVHHLPETFKPEQPFSQKSLHSAQKQIQQKGQWITVDTLSGEWSVLAFAPLPSTQNSGRMVVFGYSLKTLASQLKKEHPDQPFLLTTKKDSIGSDTIAGIVIPLDNQRIQEAIDHTQSQIHFDNSLTWNLYYTPLTILDKPLCLVVPIHLMSPRKILSNSRERLKLSAGFIVLMLVLLSLGMNHLVLAPLRKLREKAAVMVEVCSDENTESRLDSRHQGNEIHMLQQALEVASMQLYTHLGRLRESKMVLEGLALKDPLTELLNQKMFLKLLHRSLRICHRNQRNLAVFLIELDHFDMLAQTLSRHELDTLKKEIAERIQECLRGEDLLFSLSEKAFGGFLPGYGEEKDLLIVAERIRETTKQPLSINQHTHSLTLSIGVSLFPNHGEDVDLLIRHADLALDRVKADKGDGCRFYSEDF